MPMSKAGRKIKSNLKKQYGKEKGENVFYAMENQGRIPGMKKKGYQMGGQVPNQQQAAQAQRSAFNRQQAQAMGTANRMATAPSQMQNAQAQQVAQAQARQVAARQQTPSATATNQRNSAMAKMQREAALKRFAAGSQQSPAATATNQRNLALAQKNQAARSQQATPRKNMNPLFNRRRGMAEGGMVKSTGKMNTGIKKCGE